MSRITKPGAPHRKRSRGAVRIPKRKIRAKSRAPKETEDWTIVRDILYRAKLPRNDPGAYCPGGIFERASKEIAMAISRPHRESGQ